MIMGRCEFCGTKFKKKSNNQKYCPQHRKEAEREKKVKKRDLEWIKYDKKEI